MTGSTMNILMIEPLGDGGIAHYTFNLLKALSGKGVKTQLYTSRGYEFLSREKPFAVFPEMFKVASTVATYVPWFARETALPSLLRRALKLIEYPLNMLQALMLARREHVALVHFQSVNLIELVMVFAFRIIGRRVVFTIHNVLPRHERMRLYHPFLYSQLYALSNHLIIHSESGRDEVIRLFSVDPDKITVIPHGDYKFFLPDKELEKDEAKAALGIQPSSRTLLFFGAIRPNKGLDNLLKALPLVKKRIPDVKLLIAGEPCESYSKYGEIIESEEIRESVHEKLDYISHDDVSVYFTAADIVVLPYNEITQSGVLQIALAFGKPVVASALGGFNEAVEHGGNGYLVEAGDKESLAAGIVDILRNEKRMQRMGRRSRYLSDANYSWDSIGERTIDVYAKLLRENCL